MLCLLQLLLLLTLLVAEISVIAVPHVPRCWVPPDPNTAPADSDDCYKVVRKIAHQCALDPFEHQFRRAKVDIVNGTDSESDTVSRSQPEGDLDSTPFIVPYSWFEPRADRIGCQVKIDVDGPGRSKDPFALVTLCQISATAESVTNECIGMGGSGKRLRMVGREEIKSLGRVRAGKHALLVSVLGMPPTRPGGADGEYSAN